jgi:hypothetical protein
MTATAAPTTPVRHFRQILLWPLQLLPLKPGGHHVLRDHLAEARAGVETLLDDVGERVVAASFPSTRAAATRETGEESLGTRPWALSDSVGASLRVPRLMATRCCPRPHRRNGRTLE